MMQHPAVHMTAGGLAGAPVPTPGMGLGYLCRRSLLSRIKVAVCACSLSSCAVFLVRALMRQSGLHAPPRVTIPYVAPSGKMLRLEAPSS